MSRVCFKVSGKYPSGFHQVLLTCLLFLCPPLLASVDSITVPIALISSFLANSSPEWKSTTEIDHEVFVHIVPGIQSDPSEPSDNKMKQWQEVWWVADYFHQ
ncbi:MAG: hypothetical protein ACR2PX_13860 [Endozoicomonas sp.]|uniref:hypothetical protein n=1 Tax=Endozoicomonas sp. TaxID=1892382 RepID=UPI003D9ABF49